MYKNVGCLWPSPECSRQIVYRYRFRSPSLLLLKPPEVWTASSRVLGLLTATGQSFDVEFRLFELKEEGVAAGG